MKEHKSFREQLIAKGMKDCRHFNGIQNQCCKAGVNYEALREDDKYALPCLPNFVNLGKRDPARCEKFAVLSEAEAIHEADNTLAIQNKTLLAVHAAHDDASKKGLHKGAGGLGEMPCPVQNCKGVLRYSVASYNGHMHAKCTAASCVSWME